jgi:hypothetical protein
MIVKADSSTFPDLPPDQFAARFGYGISTAPDPSRPHGGSSDPNEAMVGKMSVAERVAYYLALYGPGTKLDSEGFLTSSITSSDDSCEGRAAAAQPTDQEQQSAQQRLDRVRTAYRSLLDQVQDLGNQELADARVKAATQAWSGCMATAGFPGYDDLDAPRAAILREARTLMGHEVDATGIDPAKVTAMRQKEIDTAVADNSCRKAWDQTFAAVRQELEAQFVQENLTELKSYRSALAAASR